MYSLSKGRQITYSICCNYIRAGPTGVNILNVNRCCKVSNDVRWDATDALLVLSWKCIYITPPPPFSRWTTESVEFVTQEESGQLHCQRYPGPTIVWFLLYSGKWHRFVIVPAVTVAPFLWYNPDLYERESEKLTKRWHSGPSFFSSTRWPRDMKSRDYLSQTREAGCMSRVTPRNW